MFDNRLEFKSAVVGMVLGDGCITNPKGRTNCILSIQHSVAQKEYALYKKDLLEYLTAVSIYEYYRPDTREEFKGTKPSVTIHTRRHPFYSKLRDRMYVDGRKQITEHILKIISPLGIALWYMDDGTFIPRMRTMYGNQARDWQLRIATCSFSEAEHSLAQYYFNKRFNITWKIERRKNRNDNWQYLLALYKISEIEKFFNLVGKYIVPSMSYKHTKAPLQGEDIVRTSG